MSSPALHSTVTVMGADYPVARDLPGHFGGIDVRYDACGTEKAFGTVLAEQPFQATEFSLSNYTMMRDRGADWMVAIPVFLNRAFRHGVAYVAQASPLTDLRQLAGKRVGMREYSQTAAVWFRGLLADEYGVDWRDVQWFSPRKQRFAAPAAARVTELDGDLEAMVLAGELDAYVSPRAVHPQLRPLLRNHAAAEQDYLARTGILPINHTVVIHRAVLDAQPGAARAVFDAWCHGRASAHDARHFGFAEPNRTNVETLLRYLHEQQLVQRRYTIDDLFTLVDAVDG